MSDLDNKLDVLQVEILEIYQKAADNKATEADLKRLAEIDEEVTSLLVQLANQF